MADRDFDDLLSGAAEDVAAVATGAKPWYQARRGWGLLIFLGATGYNMLALQFGWPSLPIDIEGVQTSADQVAQAVGLAVFAWGAIKASRPLSLTKPKA